MEKCNTLLVLASETPQVITESIYGYWHQYQITFDELIIVTTSSYPASLLKSLASSKRDDGNGPLQGLLKDYHLPALDLSSANIVVPKDEHGAPLNDVCSPSEMQAFADTVLELVCRLTANENSRLHASLAGGRRTMTFYLSFAMSVYAREDDTLSHVFAPPNMHNSDFYYPKPDEQVSHPVMLANIPFVRLRPSLPDKYFAQKLSFTDAEEVYRLLNAPVALEVSYPERHIICSGITFSLSPANLAFYLVMVDDLLNANEGFDCPASDCPDTTLALLYINKRLEIEHLPASHVTLGDAIKTAEAQLAIFKQNEISGLKDGLKKSFFTSRKNQISQALRSELPEIVAEHYDIDAKEILRRKNATRPARYYGLNIEQRFVTVIK